MMNNPISCYAEIVRRLCSPKSIYIVLLGALSVTGLVVWFLHKSEETNSMLLCAKYFVGLVALSIVGMVLFIVPRRK